MEQVKSNKLSPFDITANINEKKGILDADEVGYNAYIINRAFSNTADSVLFANEMNRYWSLDKQQQYDFYYHGLMKKRRFGKWYKNQDDTEEIALIKEYYGFSTKKAKDVLTLVRDKLPDIRQELEKGGRKNGSRKARNN